MHMWNVSPIAHVGKVTCPTLLGLGAKDRRVPSSQGKEWYKALRNQGVKAQ